MKYSKKAADYILFMANANMHRLKILRFFFSTELPYITVLKFDVFNYKWFIEGPRRCEG